MKIPTLLAATLLLGAATSRGQTAILWNGNPPRPGNPLREDVRITLEKGRLSLDLDQQTLHGTASASVHETVERTYVSATEQKIDVLESSRNIRFGFGNGNGEPKDTAGHLLGKKLSGKKNGNRWVFTLAGRKDPDGAEASALKQFTAYCEAVEALGLLYGTAPRKVGETWKPDLGGLKKSNPDIDAGLECKLEAITPRQGDTVAQIAVTGRLSANIGNGGAVQLAINAVILRSLRDMVDLDTRINGNFRYAGKFGKGDNQAEITAPLQLTRTVQPAKK